MSNETLSFLGVPSGKVVTVRNKGQTVLVNVGHSSAEIPVRHLLTADYHQESRTVKLSYICRKKSGKYGLNNVEGQLKVAPGFDVQVWIDSLLNTAYEGVKRGRRLKVIVNPHSGVKKGRLLFTKIIEPIFRAAGCSIDIDYTTRGGHAFDIAKTISLDFDAVISVSGDGLVHEIINGFAQHEHPTRAFDIPIAPIPTGSGNGLALNLLGIEDGFDVVLASLNGAKGFAMKVDVFSFVQNGNRSFSFMSQSLGLMADLDVGTDHLRWMGESRFTYGLLRGLIKFKSCPLELSYKLVEHDKDKMVEVLQARRHADKNGFSPFTTAYERYGDNLPPLKYLSDSSDGWVKFDKPLLYIYAGKGPYVGRDFMAFPVSLPNDGLIDIVLQSVAGSSRSEILLAMAGAPKGEPYWNKSEQYVKAEAYRMKPLSDNGHLSIDGEPFPFKEYHVEVHKELATLLSPHGYYAADFQPRAKS